MGKGKVDELRRLREERAARRELERPRPAAPPVVVAEGDCLAASTTDELEEEFSLGKLRGVDD